MPRRPDKPYGWIEVDIIAELLEAAHPSVDPLSVRFPDLRRMVTQLPGFAEEPGHPVNEKILERIQALWLEERDDSPREEDD
jgi:FeS assembly protein IscX